MDIAFENHPTLGFANLLAAFDTAADWIELGLMIVVIAIAVMSIRYWYWAFGRLRNGQELIPYQRSECVLGFIDLVAIFVFWAGAQVFTGVVLVAIAGRDAMRGSEVEVFEKHGVWLLYLSAAFGIGSLVVGGSYLVLRYRTTNSFGLRIGQLGKQIGYGVVVFVMLFPVTLLIQYLLSLLVKYEHPVMTVLAENPSFVSIFGCWAAAVLQAPFVEEFLFRGVFQHWMERLSISKLNDDRMLLGGSSLAVDAAAVGSSAIDGRLGGRLDDVVVAEIVNDHDGADPVIGTDANPFRAMKSQVLPSTEEVQSNLRRFGYWPIFVSSLCFALVHYGQGLAPIPLFILALGLGYLFRQTGSLVACITVHFLLNFYSMFVFTVMILLGESP